MKYIKKPNYYFAIQWKGYNIEEIERYFFYYDIKFRMEIAEGVAIRELYIDGVYIPLYSFIVREDEPSDFQVINREEFYSSFEEVER
jgi:hypothetical protein